MIAELLNTLWVSSIYSLMSVPLTLSYRVTKIINFAHISFITYGAYVAVIFSLLLPLGLIETSLIVFLVVAVLAVLNHMLVLSPLMSRGTNVVTLMIASMGSWIFLKYLLYALVSSAQKVLRVDLFYVTPNIAIPSTIIIGEFRVSTFLLISNAMNIMTLLFLYVFLMKVKLGRAMRAVADNAGLAQITGISKNAVLNATWILTGGIAALGGLAWSLSYYASPELGDNVILQVFACSVIGGLSSIPLTFAGAFVIAFAENILIAWLHTYLGLDVSFRPFISFLTLLLVILIRPPAGGGGGLPYRFKLPFRGDKKRSTS